MINAIKNYFVGAFQEMKKVTWPTKSQTINYSIMVIALSVGMALFFGVLDYIFNWGVTNIGWASVLPYEYLEVIYFKKILVTPQLKM